MTGAPTGRRRTPRRASDVTRKTTIKTRLTSAVLAGILPAIALAALTGCRGERSRKPPRELLVDMDDQPRWNPQTKSKFFADGRTMRQPVTGTVPYGRRVANPDDYPGQEWAGFVETERASLLKEGAAEFLGLAEGVDPAKAWANLDPAIFVDRIPIEVTPALLARGQERFNIYCSVCHGYQGEGGGKRRNEATQLAEEYGGMVGRRWSTGAVPTFHDPKYQPGATEKNAAGEDVLVRTGRDGYIFYVAMHGVLGPGPSPADPPVNKMPSYAHALSARDAWGIVAYIRALQLSQRATLADVPDDQRDILRAQRPGTGGGE